MAFGPVECLGVLAVLVGLAVPAFLLARGTTVIGEGQVAVVERHGKFSRVLHAGQHILMPGGDSIRALVPLQEFIYETGSQQILTRNLAQIEISALANYQIARQAVVEGKKRWHRIDTEAVYHAVYSADDWQEATQAAARSTLAETFSLLDLRADILDVPGWQDEVALLMRQRVNEKTRRWGVQVTDVAFNSVRFPEAVNDTLLAEVRLHREAQLREIEAASLKEVEQTLGLSPSDLMNWRYVETLREIARNPHARIVVSPEPFPDQERETQVAPDFSDNGHANL